MELDIFQILETFWESFGKVGGMFGEFFVNVF
jgi:hypothetical protein